MQRYLKGLPLGPKVGRGVPIRVVLPQAMADGVERYVKVTGVTVSEAVRTALREFLAHMGEASR